MGANGPFLDFVRPSTGRKPTNKRRGMRRYIDKPEDAEELTRRLVIPGLIFPFHERGNDQTTLFYSGEFNTEDIARAINGYAYNPQARGHKIFRPEESLPDLMIRAEVVELNL